MLLEIGCSRSADRLDRKGKKFERVNNEETIQKELTDVAKEMLPHTMGERYSQAVVACLNDSFDEYARTEKGAAELHKAFTYKVPDVLV